MNLLPEIIATLPRYVCHKEVRALKISACVLARDPLAQIPEGTINRLGYQYPSVVTGLSFYGGYPDLPVDQEWASKHSPRPGGYLVIYADGYTSYSPAAAFESGYSPAP